jgi:hypothetical protein
VNEQIAKLREHGQKVIAEIHAVDGRLAELAELSKDDRYADE